MVNQTTAVRRPALVQRLLKSIEHETDVRGAADPPADDVAGKDIDDDTHTLSHLFYYLCLSFGPVAHVSVQVVRKDRGSSNATAVLQDQAPHDAPRQCPAICGAEY